MTDIVIAPEAGAAWQRAILVLLAVWGLLLLFVLPAGQFIPPLITLVIALAVAASAPGNRRYKLIVVSWLSVLLTLSLVSLAWA